MSLPYPAPIVRVADVYGRKLYVMQSELAGTRTQLRIMRRDGWPRSYNRNIDRKDATTIHRDNIAISGAPV